MKRVISIAFGALLLASTIAIGSQAVLANGNSMKDQRRIERHHHHKHHHRHTHRAHRVRVSKLSY